jgi:hypothetical protein
MTLRGIDISNHQESPSAYRDQRWYADAEFVIAQAIPRPSPDGYTGAQLRAALDDGKHRGIYTWMWDDPTWRMGDHTVEGDHRIRLATVPEDVPLNIRPWEDLEDNQSAGWQSVSVGQRIGNARRALDLLDTWAIRRGLAAAAGIYWSDYYVGLLYDGWDGDGRVQWKAHYGITPGILIGGNVVAHQYTSSPVDMNIMLESEIVVPTKPPTEPTTAEFRQALSYLSRDVIGPLNTYKYARIKRAVAEMERVSKQYGAA